MRQHFSWDRRLSGGQGTRTAGEAGSCGPSRAKGARTSLSATRSHGLSLEAPHRFVLPFPLYADKNKGQKLLFQPGRRLQCSCSPSSQQPLSTAQHRALCPHNTHTTISHPQPLSHRQAARLYNGKQSGFLSSCCFLGQNSHFQRNSP